MASGSKRRSGPSGRGRRYPQNEATKLVRLELNAKALLDMIAGRQTILPSLPNMQDNLVVQTLSTAKIGDLPVDQFGRWLCKDGTSPRERDVIALRLALIRVYLAAANARRYTRATRAQLKSAQAALSSLLSAIEQIDQVRPPRQRGLQALFGSPIDDPKGLDELTDFGSRCSKIKTDIVPIMMDLSGTIEAETAKPKANTAGERKKRLRTLVEALANWWRSATGKSLAPYVHAKRLDHRPAFVVGRSGEFIELAQAVFSNIDEFKKSEVISAVTNVHESQLPERNNK